MKIEKLTVGQYLGWVFASAVFGICVIYVGVVSGVLSSDDWYVPAVILAIGWGIGTMLMRLYIQDKDPTSFRSILGIQRKKD